MASMPQFVLPQSAVDAHAQMDARVRTQFGHGQRNRAEPSPYLTATTSPAPTNIIDTVASKLGLPTNASVADILGSLDTKLAAKAARKPAPTADEALYGSAWVSGAQSASDDLDASADALYRAAWGTETEVA